MEQLELPYLVKLQIFEGPLDLLLQLIRKNKVDIYDIPIAKITQQYLDYLEILKRCDLEVVGDEDRRGVSHLTAGGLSEHTDRQRRPGRGRRCVARGAGQRHLALRRRLALP